MSGSCASIIATNISTHPRLSFIDNFSCRITHPASTEKHDSRLNISDAIVGFTFLCPIICNVYATPQESTPAYKIGIHADIIATISGVSKTNIHGSEATPHTKNCIHERTTPLTLGEK